MTLSAPTFRSPRQQPFRLFAICLVAGLSCLQVSAWAQQPGRPGSAPPAASPPEAPAPELPPPVYEKDLTRLAEVMGALAFLRPLCGIADEKWDSRMQELLAAEAPTGSRRERLVGAFNRGYEAFALTYRTCTDSAQIAAARFLREGSRLSQSITSRYGG